MTIWRWLCLLALLAWGPAAIAEDDAADVASTWLLIQTGKHASFDGSHLTFVDEPTSVAFADRPRRLVTAIPIEDFVNVVWKAGGPASLASVPPNAALTFHVAESGSPGVAVVELREPAVIDNRLRYRVTVLEGRLPPELGAITLVIDGFPIGADEEVNVLQGQVQDE